MENNKPKFTLIDHTADLGMIVHGDDLKNLFETAAVSMLSIMLTGTPGGIAKPLNLSVEAQDAEDLMVRWLGEILYLFEGEKVVASKIQIESISPFHLKATLHTLPFDTIRQKIVHEIKAVTYHEIEVTKKDILWEARIIFDL